MESVGTFAGQTKFELAKLMSAHHHAQLSNSESYPTKQSEEVHPMVYRIWATLIHSVIFILGVAGNIVLVIVVRKTKTLQTSTYCYLVSLAIADLIVLLSAVPEAIISHHVGWQWLTGQVGCSLMVFTNFLGINAGSLSILAFTLDRYIAACKPLLILRICNWNYARKVVVGTWIFSILYCAPWLGLTQVRPHPDIPEYDLCDLRLTKELYFYWFIADLLLFYVIPLIIAAVVYARLGMILRRSIVGYRVAAQNFEENQIGETALAEGPEIGPSTIMTAMTRNRTFNADCKPIVDSPLLSRAVPDQTDEQTDELWVDKPIDLKQRYRKLRKSRTRVFRMLVIIVVLFAVTWLPFRGLLIYNSLASKPWYSLLYLFFAKTCIYFNCAVNPYLYNIMSRRFRDGLWTTLSCQNAVKQ